MSTHRPSALENEYFAREDSDRRRRLAIAQAQQEAATLQARLRAEPQMHCPRCGSTMRQVEDGSVKMSGCEGCGGIFVDASELKAAGAKEGFLTHLLRDKLSQTWR